MPSPERQIQPTDRRISGYTIAFGVVGALVVSTGFFFLGMLCIGPWFKEHMKPIPRVQHAAVPTPARPSPPVEVRNEAPADTAGQPDGSLDVQVTEDGQDPTADGSQADSGVKQDSDGLTVTLEPNGQQKADQSGTSSEEVAKPTEPPAPRSHVDRPKPEAASESAPVTHASSSSSGGRGRYRVQTGTFASRANADALAKDLRGHGYNPDVRTVQGEAGTLYRVEVGDYKTRQGAQDLVDELSGKGYSPSVTTSR